MQKCIISFTTFSRDLDGRSISNLYRFVSLFMYVVVQLTASNCLLANKKQHNYVMFLFIGNCQRLAFTVGVFQHMHKITNPWKYELNQSSKLRDNNERKKHHCHTKFCAFRCLISRLQILNMRSLNQIREKKLLSRKLHYFRGSRFSQCYILSTSPHYSLPRKVLC